MIPDNNFDNNSAIPDCAYFGSCGGCSSQHISYAKQLEDKTQFVREATGFAEVKAFGGSPYNYRNRLDMAFTAGGLGFKKKGNWRESINIKSCSIARPELNRIIHEIEEDFSDVDAFNPSKREGTFHHALIRVTALTSAISFVLNKDSPQLELAKTKILQFAAKSRVENIIFTRIGREAGSTISDDFDLIKGSDYLIEEILGKKFIFPIQGFFQNNLEVATMMQEYCGSLLSKYETSSANFLDLYGGVGTFGILHAAKFKETLLIESFAESISCAKRNIELNKTAAMQALLLDAKNLRSLQLPAPLFVVTDPPRSGMHPKTISTLIDLKPEVIIYISCNPKLLKDDLPKFMGAYNLKSAAMFDMFPQTPHCEAIVELARKPL
jgi:23S rRNA (uracil-5-)-methyltransferase RumA